MLQGKEAVLVLVIMQVGTTGTLQRTPHFPIVHILVPCHPLKYSTITLVHFNLPTSEGEEQLCFQALDITLDP